MTSLPEVGDGHDNTPFPGEIIRNLSILTQELDTFGLAPDFGEVGDHSRLQGVELDPPTLPTRRQNCSQVVIRKQDGQYHPYVDGVKSSVPTEAVIHRYRGEDVQVSIRRRSGTQPNEQYRARRGFLDKASSQRLIGPLSIAVVVEDGQPPPDKVEVRVWQETISNGSKDSRRLNGLTDLDATELASDGEIKCLNVPFPATFIHPPYIEIRDTDKKIAKDVKRYSTVMNSYIMWLGGALLLLYYDPSSAATFVGGAMLKTGTDMKFTSAIWEVSKSTGASLKDFFRWAWSFGRLDEKNARQLYFNRRMFSSIASLFTPGDFVRACKDMTPIEMWAMNRDMTDPGTTSFEYNPQPGLQKEQYDSSSPYLPNRFTQTDKTIDVKADDVRALQKSAKIKISNAMITGVQSLFSFPGTMDRSSRVRMTLSQLADALTQLADKAGSGMILELDESKIPRRERVLRNFLAQQDRYLVWMTLKDAWRWFADSRKPADGQTTTERNM